MCFRTGLLALFCFYPQILFAASFHTPPNCWEKERVYHLNEADGKDILQIFSNYFSIERLSRPIPEDVTLSPNQSYAYFLEPAEEVFTINIFTERTYLTVIKLTGVHGVGGVNWVNEKLLLIRVWLSRIAGADILFDVEAERILYRMPFRWGGIEYNQWKEACENPYWRNEEVCSKPCYSIH